MADQVSEIAARLVFTMDGDALDFAKTGRGVLVVEDNAASLPLPKGDKGDRGDKGDPGNLKVDLVLDEVTDSAALAVLRTRSVNWTALDESKIGFFALNEPTRTGFFFSRAGWVTVRDVFGANSEITPGEFTRPVLYKDREQHPTASVGGVTVYSLGGRLYALRPDGTRVTLA
ncbi:MAG: hypothetical protein PHW63_11465 [Alphaproteobacteria bacterium]|nr:hypothetical protein [Alphaproteobacteria bacterium]